MRTYFCLSLVAAITFAGCNADKPKPAGKSGKGGETAAPDKSAAAGTEYWSGSITMPTGLKLMLGVTLEKGAAGYTGVVDIPAQAVAGLALRDVARAGDKIGFTVAPPKVPEDAWGVIEATVTSAGDKASGTMKVSSVTLPIELVRVASAADLPSPRQRPQTPKPPFPYVQREVSYDNPSEKCKLAGTMTLPTGAGPFPALVLISGSGAQDRDETIFDHKPFLVIADYLTRRGVVVLRVDDRAIGQTTCKAETSTVEAHAGDVAAGVAFLAAQKEVDPGKIGLLGHSEGGVIAPLLAAQSDKVGFVITLAGPGVSGGELIPMQLRAMFAVKKELSPAAIDAAVAEQVKVMEAIKADADVDTIEKLVRGGLDVLAKHVPELAALTPEQRDAKAAAERASFGSPWFRSFVKLDPRTLWPKVKVPVLALFGGKDFQVPADVNLAALAKSVGASGNKDVTTRKLAGLNHLFQLAATGMLDEYAELEETFNPDALALIGDWMAERGFASK